MADNREIVFSARDTGVEALVARMGVVVDDFSRSLQQLSEQTAQSSNDAIRYLEQQIELIEKKNRTYREGMNDMDRGRASSSVENPTTTSDEANETLSNNVQQNNLPLNEGESQIEILREILEALREGGVTPTAQTPATPSPNTTPATAPTSRQSSSGGGGGGFIRGGIAQPLGGGLTGGGSLQQLSQMASSNPYTALALAVVAAIGGEVAIAKGDQDATSDLATLTGEESLSLRLRGVGRAASLDEGVTSAQSLNVDVDEYRQRLAQTVRNYGTSDALNDSSGLRGLYLEKGGAVEGSTVASLEKLTRIIGGGDALDIGNQVYEGLVESGAFGRGGDDMSRTNELISNFVEIQKNNFYRTGQVLDNESVIGLMNTLEGFGGRYSDAQFASSSAQSIITGTGDISNPNLRALKTGIGRQLYPDLDFFDLQAKIQSGDPEMLDELIEKVKGSGFSSSNQKFQLKALLPGVQDSVISDLISGKTTSTEALKGKTIDFEDRASLHTPKISSTLTEIKEAIGGYFSTQVARDEKTYRLLKELL